MIRIRKPADAPEILRIQGKRRRRAHCESYTKSAAEYDAGKKSFPFDHDIYAHPTVKDKLIEAQHGKCCYCEAVVGLDGDVEHYRPKAGSRQGLESPLERPGYYWLAYEWENLLLSCHVCNERHKRSLFPLYATEQRVRTHHDDDNLSHEFPILIHPGKEDPEQYIRFDLYTPVAVNDHERGKKNIQLLGLNRKTLREARLEHLEYLALMRRVLDLTPANEDDRDTIEQARLVLKSAVEDDAKFASMARCAAERDFRFGIL